MSVYDGTVIKDGSTLDVNRLASELTNELPARSESSSGGVQSTASTTWVVVNTKTFSVEADEIIDWTANFAWSVSDTACNGQIGMYLDGVLVENAYPLITAGPTATNGLVHAGHLSCHVADLSAGSHVFTVEIQRSGGSGTLYVGKSYAWFKVSKRRT